GLGSMAERQVVQMPVEIFLQLPSARIALAEVWFQAVADDRLDCRRHRLVPAANSRWRLTPLLDHALQNLRQRAAMALEWMPSREQLVEDHAERIDIARIVQP